MPQSCLITALLASCICLPVAADNWNQFRGPRGDGDAGVADLPIHWSEEENVVWKRAIRGRAWSSPVIWGEDIWMTSATEDGSELYAICVDAASGEVKHDLTVFEIASPMFCYPYNSYASPTPVVEQGRLYVHYGSAGTACLDTETGATIWQRQDLPCDHHRGPGSSPIVDEDRLYANFDGYDVQYVVALDKRTGDTVWKTDRDIDYGSDDGDRKKAYATPTLISFAGRRQLISPAAVATIAYDPADGSELWKVYHGGFNAAARPLFHRDSVIINLEGGLRLLAVRPDGVGNVTDTHIQWVCRKATPTRPSQLVIGERLFMTNDKGIVSCVSMDDGKPIWTHRVGGAHSASPIHAAGRIYFFDEEGTSHVIAADPEKFELLATNQLNDGCMASPAVVDNALIVRTKTHLYRIEQ